MLQAQVNYWNLQENIRHDLAQEDLGYQTLTETIRHNQTVEVETQRHNVATEEIAWSTLEETVRHDYVMEDIGYKNAASQALQAQAAWKNAITNAFNAETQRMSVENDYQLGRMNIQIAQQNADTAYEKMQHEWLTTYTQQETNKENTDVNKHYYNLEAWFKTQENQRGWASFYLSLLDTVFKNATNIARIGSTIGGVK